MRLIELPSTNTQRPAYSLARWLVAVIVFMAAPRAFGTQHLIEPGRDWQDIIQTCRPGDEILLMPGVHRSATLKNLIGTADQPITIRGLDANNPAVFRAHREALTLVDARHVVIENMVFESSGMHGIALDAVPRHRSSDDSKPYDGPGHVVIRNITITRTGPDASARPIFVNGYDRVTVEQCTITDWTGVGIEFIASTQGIVRDCEFTSGGQYEPELAISMRGGTRDCTITSCRFENAGTTACISFGGKTKLEDLRNFGNAIGDASQNTIVEAANCRVTRSTFVDQPCPVLFSHASKCSVRQSTFVRPRRWLCAMLTQHDDPSIAQSSRPVFGSNLVVWNSGDLTGLFLVDADTRNVTLVLESNLWWSNEDADVRQRMIPTIVEEAWEQVVDVNPMLDENLIPANDEASIYGAGQYAISKGS